MNPREPASAPGFPSGDLEPSGDFGDIAHASTLSPSRPFTMRPVQRGQATVDKIEIASGLKAGEQVITEGADRLKDGAPVVLPGDKPKGMNGAGGGKRQRPAAPADGPKPGASAAGDGAAPASMPASDAASAQRQRRASQAEGA